MRANPRKVDLASRLQAPMAIQQPTKTKPRRARPAVVVVEEPPPVAEPIQQARPSPGKLTASKQQKSNMPVRSGLTKVVREVIDEPVWYDDSIDKEHEATIEDAVDLLFRSGMVSLASMVESKHLLGIGEFEANKLIWRIAREREG